MTDHTPDIPRTGPAYWSAPRMFAVTWVIVTIAGFLNLLMIAGAARLFGHPGLPVGLMALWMFPLTLLGALWMSRWIRRMVADADTF